MAFPGESRFPHLFQTAKLGKLEVKNRVKYGACCVSNYNDPDGTISEREIARTRVIAESGCGIITNQGAYPDPLGEGKAYIRQVALYDERFLPQFERIANYIHENGSIAIQQILHAGRYGGIDLGYCVQPSVIPQTLPHFRPPREMTKEDIRRTIADHTKAARLALQAGFDGIELTSFMGYMLANFNSKFTNQRTDEYGGSTRNRGRFMTELIESIKEEIGDDHPLIVRLNGAELMDRYGGNTEDECFELMHLAAETGIDMISVTVGWQEAPRSIFARDVPPGHWNRLSVRAKAENPNVPVAFGVRLADPRMAEEALAKGEFDFWEVCRPFLADPELLLKTMDDRIDEVRPCIGSVMCLARLFRDLPYLCTVNPQLGHEVEPEYHVVPATLKKKVMVIGGGVAGMEYAITAAKRGHEVEIYEATDQTGGQLRLHATNDLAWKDDLFKLLNYYDVQIKKREIPVHLNTPVTLDLVRGKAHQYDVAIVATGAYVDRLACPGGERAISAYDFLTGKAQPGQRVVVIGGGKVGLVVAERIASDGHEVSIVESGRRIAEDVIPTWKWRHTAWVQELKIKTYTRSNVKEIGDEGVTIVDANGEETVIPADTVIVSTPRRPRQELAQALEFSFDELHVVGDAATPHGLEQAIHNAYNLGTRV